MRTKLFPIILAILMSVCISKIHAQVAINTTGNPPSPGAILDVSSASMGILIPRMTTAQRTAIPDLQDGLLLYDTDTHSFWYSQNSAWVEIIGSSNSGWVLTGNSGTNPATDFIGTSDNQPLVFKTNNIFSGIIHPNGSTFFGYQAGRYDNGNTNSGFGAGALGSNNGGWHNTAVGNGALQGNTDGCYNTAVGFNSLNWNNGSFNTALGRNSLSVNQTGNNNTALGHDALKANSTGSFNTAAGDEALISNTLGSYNVAFGRKAAYFNEEGNDNTAVGYRALSENAYGSGNTFVGHFADLTSDNFSYSTAVGNQATISGNNSTALGHGTWIEGFNSTAIGDGAHVISDNTVRLGNDEITTLYCTGPYLDSTGTMAPNMVVDSTGRIMRSTLTPTSLSGQVDKVALWNTSTQLGYDTNLHWNSSLHNMGIGTVSPDSSAILDLTSNSKGFLPPRLTKVQRQFLANPATGLLIYQTDSLPGYYYFNGDIWTQIVGEDLSHVGRVVDSEGNFYSTVRIGDQIWMAEDLKTTHYNNGSSIPPRFYSSNDTTECWVDIIPFIWASVSGFDTLYIYPDLFHYSYEAVNHPWGLCPTGWHVPSRFEWLKLLNYIGFDETGNKLRATKYWKTDEFRNLNTSRFSALPAYQTSPGDWWTWMFDPTTQYTRYWTSTEYDDTHGYAVKIDFYSVIIIPYQVPKNEAYTSVRCIKD